MYFYSFHITGSRTGGSGDDQLRRDKSDQNKYGATGSFLSNRNERDISKAEKIQNLRHDRESSDWVNLDEEIC